MKSKKEHINYIVHPAYKSLEPFILSLPEIFHKEGEIIYKGRNELRRFSVASYELVVKSYQIPHLLNRLVYCFFRPSKAERSYTTGLILQEKGIDTPQPVGFINCTGYLLLGHSYSVTLKSKCSYIYNDLNRKSFEKKEEIFHAIGTFTARLHENMILHKDYSGGNILFDIKQDNIYFELVDLNRIRFTKVGLEKGCRNFERLYTSESFIRIMAEGYAKKRNFDPALCMKKIIGYINHERRKRLKKE